MNYPTSTMIVIINQNVYEGKMPYSHLVQSRVLLDNWNEMELLLVV